MGAVNEGAEFRLRRGQRGVDGGDFVARPIYRAPERHEPRILAEPTARTAAFPASRWPELIFARVVSLALIFRLGVPRA